AGRTSVLGALLIASGVGQAALAGARADARRRGWPGLAVRAASRVAGRIGTRMVGVARAQPRPDAAILARGWLGRLAHRPAHQQKQRHDRDLQAGHQPDEGPCVHCADRIPGGRCPQPSPRRQGAPLKCVIARSSRSLATISSGYPGSAKKRSRVISAAPYSPCLATITLGPRNAVSLGFHESTSRAAESRLGLLVSWRSSASLRTTQSTSAIARSSESRAI